MSFGFVYCIDNFQVMPGLYKIGHTFKSPHQRAAELSTTGVPEPFSVVGYIEVDRPDVWERRFHQFLEEFRCNTRREFFKAPIEVIAPLFMRNEWAVAVVDVDFSPAVFLATRKSVDEFSNPYHVHPWLGEDPRR